MSMKLDFLKTHEVEDHAKDQPTPQGGLQLRVSDPHAAIYVTGHGVEVLAGIGSCDCVFSQDADATFRVEAKKGARSFLTLAPRQSYEPHGERYTNMDRMPSESGTMNEITRALREFKLKQNEVLREVKAQKRDLDLARAKSDQDAQPDDQEESTPSEAVAKPKEETEPDQ